MGDTGRAGGGKREARNDEYYSTHVRTSQEIKIFKKSLVVLVDEPGSVPRTHVGA